MTAKRAKPLALIINFHTTVSRQRFLILVTKPFSNLTAPEIISDGKCYKSSDIFSIGVLIISVFNNGTPPFDAKTSQSYKSSYDLMDISKAVSQIPGSMQSVVRSMLKHDPNERRGFNALIGCDEFETDQILTISVRNINFIIVSRNAN